MTFKEEMKDSTKNLSMDPADTVPECGYLFHPFEISVCGFSGSGKTTLISRLISELGPCFDVGYIKYGVKEFSMDREGKDTKISWDSGAVYVSISDPVHAAFITRRHPSLPQMRNSFSVCDFVFIEGLKHSQIPKIVILDSDMKVIELIKNGEIENVLCLVGDEDTGRLFTGEMPFFSRDDTKGISEFILRHLRSIANSIPLYGLVLAGGRSRRMKTDKAMLNYHGKPQVRHLYELLSGLCERVYVSAREDQFISEDAGELPKINDRFNGLGPLSGVLSAMSAYPDTAWLVVACDLPYLNTRALNELLGRRNPFRMATCFRNRRYDMPEPLCTVYEPKIRYSLFLSLSCRDLSLTSVLKNSPVETIPQPEGVDLENVNTQQGYILARKRVGR